MVTRAGCRIASIAPAATGAALNAVLARWRAADRTIITTELQARFDELPDVNAHTIT